MKLKSAAKTKLYELTYLVPGSFTDSELGKVQETVQGLVKKHSGKIVSEESWGKKPLAYAVRRAGKDHDEASYNHAILEFPSTAAPDFERDVYLEESVIRHLFVEAEKPKANQSPAAEQETPTEEAAEK